MNMNKLDRQKIYEKYGGKCAYCGCELAKGWHASPIQPIKLTVTETGQVVEENNELSNIVGACVNCAMSKTHIGMNGRTEQLTIENFRNAIIETFELLKQQPYYKRALKFGMITETGKEFKFYFETVTAKPSHTPPAQ